MGKVIQKSFQLPVLLAVLLLLAKSACAGAPEGHPDSLDSNLRIILQNRLIMENYMAHYRNGQDLSRGISAYLWDNRQRLTSMDFSEARQVDVLVCLMKKKGYDEFAEYTAGIIDWCSQIIKAP